MTILLVILGLTLALAWRAGLPQRCWKPASVERSDETGLMDACTRASVLVLMSLVGLLALGVTYGNVLGMGATNP